MRKTERISPFASGQSHFSFCSSVPYLMSTCDPDPTSGAGLLGNTAQREAQVTRLHVARVGCAAIASL